MGLWGKMTKGSGGTRKTMGMVGLGGRLPQHYYSQEMLLAALQEYWGDQIENPQVLRRLHRHVSVDGRFLALPKEEYLKMKTWGEANHHWIRTAKELGEKAVRGALADAGLHGRHLGAFFFVSVTGISSPSIDALLINQMGLCRSIRRVPIFGLGCVPGAAARSPPGEYLRAPPPHRPGGPSGGRSS